LYNHYCGIELTFNANINLDLEYEGGKRAIEYMANDTNLDIIVDELNQDYEKVTKLAPVIPVGKVYSTDDIYHSENGTENGTENENVTQYNY